MILQELYRLAEREQLMTEPDYEDKPVAWLVRVAPGGKLLAIQGTHFTPEAAGRRTPRPVPKRFSVPRQPNRTSRDRAHFLCDKAEYVFGIDPQKKGGKTRSRSKLAARFRLFRDEVERCAEASKDDGVQAVAALLESVAAGKLAVTLPSDCQTNDLFSFVFAPDVDRLVHDREAVRTYWKNLRSRGSSEPQVTHCVVTGAPVGEAPNFPLLKKVPGGTSSGVSLVSFNNRAFESHGWTGNDNAPVSRAAAEACATALNRLIDPNPTVGGRHLPRRSIVIADDTIVCFWGADSGADAFLDPLPFLLTVEDPAKVTDMYRSLWRGVPLKLHDAHAFYALTLSGSQGRAILRDWFVSSVADVAENLAHHFRDLLIVANRSADGEDRPLPLPLKVLLAALAPPGRDGKTPPQLAAQFVSAALRGSPYPLSVLQRGLERTRAEIAHLNDEGVEGWRARERQDARAALIKAVLRRNTTLKTIGERMDPTNTNPGYLLGRLMAVLERLQQVALGDVNAGVVDRYFAAASATPRAVFVRLLKNARHHARKAQDEPQTAGTAVWLDRQIDAISAPFDPKQNGFPAFLDLQQQGLFVLGYHQQRHWLWQPKEERPDVATNITTSVNAQRQGDSR
jgi:CRISPR-associated protein Csd1